MPYIVVFLLLINRPLCYNFGLPTPILIVLGAYMYLEYLRTNKHFRRIALGRLVFIWPCLMFYHFFNALYLGVPETNSTVFLNCIQTSVLLSFTVYAYVKNPGKCLQTLIYGFITFLLLCLSMGFLKADFDNRLSTNGIHTNQIGQCAGMLSLVAALIYSKGRKRIRLYLIYAFVVAICLLTQSRNSIAIVAFSVLAFLFSVIRKIKWQYTVMIIIALFALSSYLSSYVADLPIFQRFVENSGEEQVEAYFERHQEVSATNTIIDNFLGERILYYIFGWQDFIENPVHGIGLWQFKNIHWGFPIHSEYIVHLAEGGIIGFAMYLMFLWGMLRGLWTAKDSSEIKGQLAIILGAILFVSITARLFMCEFVFPVYGCIMGHILWCKYNRR